MTQYEKNQEMAYALAAKVAAAGGRAYYVGGYVRDALLGCSTVDIDVEVHGLAPAVLEGILDELGQRMSMGESFGIYGLKGYDLDIAMPRKEQLRGRGHKDFDIFVDPHIGTLGAAKRRDFTINAMMQDVLTGEIVDHFGGKSDLEQRILRHVNDASFGEDPLRVLRGAQFAARYRLTPAAETVALCRQMDLSTLARERVMGELEKALMKSERPSVFFTVLRDMNGLDVWFPELKALIGVPQNPRYHGEGDVWNHTMLVMDYGATLKHSATEPLWFMLSALVHDFGKAVCTQWVKGTWHAYGHELQGLPLVRTFLERLTNESGLISYVLNMTELHMKPNTMSAVRSSVKKTNQLFDRSEDPMGLLCLAEADDMGRDSLEGKADSAFLQERLAVYRDIMAQPYVTGKDLIAAGLQPGKHFNELLSYAHKLRLAGESKDVALKQTLSYARRLK